MSIVDELACVQRCSQGDHQRWVDVWVQDLIDVVPLVSKPWMECLCVGCGKDLHTWETRDGRSWRCTWCRLAHERWGRLGKCPEQCSLCGGTD